MTGAARGPAFITGGSSGIGLELARLLADKGHNLALFARDSNKLQAAADVLRKEYGVRVETFASDMSVRAACEAAVSEAIRRLGAPAWAVANAGIVEPGLFLDQPIATHETHMQVNYMGAVYFARMTAQAMQGGRLVFVSSGAAFFGIYGYSAYAPSKFAMRALAEVLRIELAPRGISVTLAYPPDTDTPMLDAEEALKPPAAKAITASGGIWQPADVARLILRRAERGRFTATPGAQMTLLLWLHSLLAPALRIWQAGLVRKAAR